MEEEKCIPVRVAVRCRPLISKELHEGCQMCVRFLDSCQVVLGADKAFTYDHVFGPEDPQKFVYDTTVSKLIPEIFKGYNVTILAYGQTGSGKTFSMGTSCNSSSLRADSDAGIIPRAVQDIFGGVQQRPEKVFTIKASFLEVYKEDILDLFSSKRQEPLAIREDSTGTIKIPNLSEVAVHNTNETLQLLESGAASRRTAATCMNAHSSRSHAIFTLSVEQRAADDENDTTVAKFHFVDLAGSERAGKTKAQGERLKEGININRGLLSLGNVISALCDESAHVPYRDSKLTRLLQDSLGGNSNTIMLACISPADSNFEETLNTLRYADRARKIKNKPVVNRDPQAMELMRLKQLVQQLQAQLRTGGLEVMPKEISTVDEHTGDNDLQTLLQQLRSLGEEKRCLIEDFEQLQEKHKQLQNNNEHLNSEMHALLDQLSSQTERHIMDQMEIEQLRKLNHELSAKIESLQCAVNDEEKAEILKDIQKSLHEYKEEEKLWHQTGELQSKPSPDADNNVDPGEVSEDERCEEDIVTAETNRTFRRAAMSRELEQLNKILQAKEELASKMTLSGNQLEVVRQQYEASKRQLETELVELKKERDELSQTLLTVKSLSAPKGVSEQRRKRIQELEVRIADLRKRVQEQNKIIKMKEEAERNACKLKEEIQAMKQTRVRLMRQLKEESGRHRQVQVEMDRKVRALRLKEQRQAAALAKLERQSALRMNVLQRRMDEALAAKQRLELAAARRRDWKKHSEGGIEGLNSRVRTWLSEEVTLLSDSKKLEHHLQSLLDSRRMVAEQLREIGTAVEEKPTAEDSDALLEKQKQLEKDLREHTVQIGELQQKILDVDPEKRMRNMFNGVTDTMESQAISTCLLKMVTDKEVDAYILKMKQEETDREVEDLKAALNDTKRRMEAMEKGFEMKMVELEKQHQQQMVYLLKHSTNVTLNSNPDMDATLLDRYKAQECEISRLQYVHEELERKTKEVDQLQKELARAQMKSGKVWLEDVRTSAKKSKNPPPKRRAARVEPVPVELDWDYDLDESVGNRENDPDWSLESELKGAIKRKSAEEEKPRKTLKRSSSSMLSCKCRGPCQTKRCGCVKKGNKCTQACICKGTCAAGTSMDDAPIAEEPLILRLRDNVQEILDSTFTTTEKSSGQ